MSLILNQKHPKISIVTPSYNQGQYLTDTILSVIGQHYPNLEFIVMDGGSTDNSSEILKNFDSQITYWQSERDGGQSQAINRGFAKATGDIVGWLNSDDMYLPGTLNYIADIFKDGLLGKPSVVIGNCIFLREQEKIVKANNVTLAAKTLDLEWFDYVIQPSSFWTRETIEKIGELNESLHYAFDWEWFIRSLRQGVTFHPVERFLSVYRVHDTHKSGTGGQERLQEIAQIYSLFHSKKAAEAFLDLKNNKRIASVRRLLNRFGLPQFFNTTRLLYLLFFRKTVTWQQFNNLSKM